MDWGSQAFSNIRHDDSPSSPKVAGIKIVELAVCNVVRGEAVKNIDASANPEALNFLPDRPEQQVAWTCTK